MRDNFDQFKPGDSQIYKYLLQSHTGKTNPIKARDLAEKFNKGLREINEEVRQLRKSGVLIGSLKEPPFGYYIPANADEAREYLSAFKDELFDMLDTYNRQKRVRLIFLDSLRMNDLFEFKKDNAGQYSFA
jgi:methionine synthase II (cobalamin-independent)